MFSVGLFYTSLGLLLGLLGFRWLENQELGDGARYFSRMRSSVDAGVERVKVATATHLSFASVSYFFVRGYHFLQHYVARVIAQLSHIIEHRARNVVHRTAKRVREQGHYLEKDVPTAESTADGAASETIDK
jgi:hypothetical protein